jgi:hypothetical protein
MICDKCSQWGHAARSAGDARQHEYLARISCTFSLAEESTQGYALAQVCWVWALVRLLKAWKEEE